MDKKTRNWLMSGLALGAASGIGYVTLQRARQAREDLLRYTDATITQALERIDTSAYATFIKVNGLRLYTVIAGPREAPLALLLHGFPEHWYSWRHQIPRLVQAGYRVVAVDQRGYNLSDKPWDIEAYNTDHLMSDVREMIWSLGYERATVVGHDWGGVVAWRLAMDYPESVEKLVVMNAPHPATFTPALRENWKQRLKSWYIFFFQIPWLPETLLTLSPQATAHLFFRRTAVRQTAFSDADLEVMATALAQPGAMGAMLNWYRAALRYPTSRPLSVINTPTLLLWAEDDVALDKALSYNLEAWVSHLDIHYIPDCGHWIQNEAPDEVNRRLLKFLD
jgi:pimeloyl-ACP methyl ester carboxylesterase